MLITLILRELKLDYNTSYLFFSKILIFIDVRYSSIRSQKYLEHRKLCCVQKLDFVCLNPISSAHDYQPDSDIQN